MEEINVLTQATILDLENSGLPQQGTQGGAPQQGVDLREVRRGTAGEGQKVGPALVIKVTSPLLSDVAVTSPHGSHIDLCNLLSLRCGYRKVDSLKWWMEEGFYSWMIPVAVRYLAMPATSLSSEGLFSAAGEAVSVRRSSPSDSQA